MNPPVRKDGVDPMRNVWWLLFVVGLQVTTRASRVFGWSPIVSCCALALFIVAVPTVIIARKRPERLVRAYGASTIATLAVIAILVLLGKDAPGSAFVVPVIVATGATLVDCLRAGDVSPRSVGDFFALR